MREFRIAALVSGASLPIRTGFAISRYGKPCFAPKPSKTQNLAQLFYPEITTIE